METTPTNNLIDSLREVTDLDVVHQLYSNDVGDRLAPWLTTWIVELVNTERKARELPEGVDIDYRMMSLESLPLVEIQAGHGLAIGACKAAYGIREETAAQFAWRLLELFVAELHLRLATAVQLGVQL